MSAAARRRAAAACSSASCRSAAVCAWRRMTPSAAAAALRSASICATADGGVQCLCGAGEQAPRPDAPRRLAPSKDRSGGRRAFLVHDLYFCSSQESLLRSVAPFCSPSPALSTLLGCLACRACFDSFREEAHAPRVSPPRGAAHDARRCRVRFSRLLLSHRRVADAPRPAWRHLAARRRRTLRRCRRALPRARCSTAWTRSSTRGRSRTAWQPRTRRRGACVRVICRQRSAKLAAPRGAAWRRR